MNEIRCPKCGTVFTVDESGYADIVRQVRDEQFAAELAERKLHAALFYILIGCVEVIGLPRIIHIAIEEHAYAGIIAEAALKSPQIGRIKGNHEIVGMELRIGDPMSPV